MKTVLIAQFKHESNSFNPHPTTLDDYRARAFFSGAELLAQYRGTKSELGAFIEALEARPDVCIVPAVDANACPSGPVAHDTFAYIQGLILSALRNAGGVDAILLSLHGAMITEDSEDGEGILLRTLRKEVGPDIPIMATLDFHANLTEAMTDSATALFPARYYPHTDFYDRGRDAARLLLDTLDGKARPTGAMERLPIIYPHMPTDEGPMPELIDDLIAESGRPGVNYAYFCGGFSRADISIAGAAVYCVTENDKPLAREICRSYARRVRSQLADFHCSYPAPADAVADAIAFPGLTVLADGADNPGSGAMGDATELLHELLRQGARDVAVASIWDPETAAQAAKAGVGATIRIRLGGKSSGIVGAPIEADAYVKLLGDGLFRIKGPMQQGVLQNAGRTAVLRFEGLTVIVSSNRLQSFDMEIFRANGIEPTDYHILVVKSVVHFKAAFRALTDRLVVLDLPNVSPLDERRIPFARVPRPIYPLDPADVCAARD